MQAPELEVSEWLNTDQAIQLSALRGKVVAVHAFQMLCPACVSHGIPQTQKLWKHFDRKDLIVIGLHCVFEHHAAMSPLALRAFVHEYRLQFPIGIDQSTPSGLPRTMEKYALRGTPSLILINRAGELVAQHFGVIDDLVLGAAIGQLIS
jgi:hypothetical protein